MSRKLAAYAIGELLPGLPALNGGKTYAAWPVWRDSTSQDAHFQPMSKKQAARLWHKARRFDRQTHQPGRHGGAIGRAGLAVLYALLFDFLNFRSGQLDPSYDGIARRAGLCRRAVAAALQRLRSLGILHWLRRCTEGRDATGRFMLTQRTNAYAVLPSSQWRGYTEFSEPEPDPTAWGATPPLAFVEDQVDAAMRDGDTPQALIALLDGAADANSPAHALAEIGRAFSARFGKVWSATPAKKPFPESNS